MLRSVAVARVLLGSFLFAVLVAPLAGAVTNDTSVETRLCTSGVSTAILDITSPQSDTVVSESPVTVKGDVKDVTQISIEIDGTYASTTPIAGDQEEFSIPISLSPGTHTIHLIGNDVCQESNPDDQVVITYEPAAVPGNSGGGTIGPEAPEGQAGGEAVDAKPANPFQGIPGLEYLVPIGLSIANALDLDGSPEQGGMARQLTRFGFFTVGMGLLLFATQVVTIVAAALAKAGILSVGAMGIKASLHSKSWANKIWLLRVAGAIGLLLAFRI